MKYLLLLLLCAAVFLVCFLIDKLFSLLLPKSEAEKSGNAVRLPRRNAVAGILLIFVPLVVLLFFIPEGGDTLMSVGCAIAIVFGVILLVGYFSFAIYFDDEGFVYKDLRRKKTAYRYSQIRGQRSVLTRSGVNSILFVANDEINVYSTMQNLNAFLNKAFYKWCEAKKIDPADVENNPRMFTWFPDPEGSGKKAKK